jgi:hypothetical protein
VRTRFGAALTGSRSRRGWTGCKGISTTARGRTTVTITSSHGDQNRARRALTRIAAAEVLDEGQTENSVPAFECGQHEIADLSTYCCCEDGILFRKSTGR